MIMAITGWRWRRVRRGKVNLPKEPSASSDLHVCRGEWGECFVWYFALWHLRGRAVSEGEKGPSALSDLQGLVSEGTKVLRLIFCKHQRGLRGQKWTWSRVWNLIEELKQCIYRKQIQIFLFPWFYISQSKNSITVQSKTSQYYPSMQLWRYLSIPEQTNIDTTHHMYTRKKKTKRIHIRSGLML